jgi:hypothetical protein
MSRYIRGELWLFLEFFILPGAVVEGSDGCIGRVEDDLVVVGIEAGAVKVAAGGLQSVKEEAGGFVLDLMGEEHAHDLHESDLDGVGVFEDGQGERAWVTGAIHDEADALVMKSLVKETEAVAAECRRSALHAIDLDVLAAIGIFGHDGGYPLPGWVCEIIVLTENCVLIHGLQQDAAKILRKQELVSTCLIRCEVIAGIEPVWAEIDFSVKVE